MSADCSSLPLAAPRWPLLTRLRRRLPRLHHPHGFYLLCLAVLCERWAALILSSSVVLMLGERYSYARGDALRLAGLFNAASYLATLPGGLAVDHVLGSRRSLGAGMALLTLGYATLILSTQDALWLALLLLGHSLFKPSTQTVMVRLYEPQDRRFEAAQSIRELAGVIVQYVQNQEREAAERRAKETPEERQHRERASEQKAVLVAR